MRRSLPVSLVLTLSVCATSCGGTPRLGARDLPSSTRLPAETHALLAASCAPTPTTEALDARDALLRRGVEALSFAEARVLIDTTLSWHAALRADGFIDGDASRACAAETSNCASPESAAAGDVIATLRTEVDLAPCSERCRWAERATSSIAQLRGALEWDTSLVGVPAAWTDAVERDTGIEDTCPRDGSVLAAVAAALRVAADIGEAVEPRLMSDVGSCRIATLAGPISLVPVATATFARACYAVGGPPERGCDVFSLHHRPADPGEPMEVWVNFGSTLQAYGVFVRWENGEWRARSVDLAWTT